MRIVQAILAAASLAAGMPAAAQSIAAKGGTIGVGAELGLSVLPMMGVRLAGYGGSMARSLEQSGVRYDGTVEFGSASLLADLYPLAAGLRFTGGFTYNNNKVDFTGKGEGGSYTINGVSYPIADLGSLQGSVRFAKWSPYLGLGWGVAPRGGRGLYLSVDAGVQFQQPTGSLTGTCAAAVPANICSQLQSDLQAEEKDFQAAIEDSLKAYPVISVGLGYRF